MKLAATKTKTIKCELLAEGCDGQNNTRKYFAKKATTITLKRSILF